MASAYPFSVRGVNKTDWIQIDRATYDACLDGRDYRPHEKREQICDDPGAVPLFPSFKTTQTTVPSATLHSARNRAPPPRARNRIVKAVAASVRRRRRLGRQEHYDAIKFPVLRLVYGHRSEHYVVDAEMMPAHTDAPRQHRSNFSPRETRHAGRSGLRKGGVHQHSHRQNDRPHFSSRSVNGPAAYTILPPTMVSSDCRRAISSTGMVR